VTAGLAPRKFRGSIPSLPCNTPSQHSRDRRDRSAGGELRAGASQQRRPGCHHRTRPVAGVLGGQAAQAPLRSVRTGSVSQRSSTGVSGHQRSPRVQRNRRSLALQVTQLGERRREIRIVVPKVRLGAGQQTGSNRRPWGSIRPVENRGGSSERPEPDTCSHLPLPHDPYRSVPLRCIGR
jgi:hypothetical protein